MCARLASIIKSWKTQSSEVFPGCSRFGVLQHTISDWASEYSQKAQSFPCCLQDISLSELFFYANSSLDAYRPNAPDRSSFASGGPHRRPASYFAGTLRPG